MLPLPDDDKRYELYNGLIVEMETSSRDNSKAGFRIGLLKEKYKLFWPNHASITLEASSDLLARSIIVDTRYSALFASCLLNDLADPSDRKPIIGRDGSS